MTNKVRNTAHKPLQRSFLIKRGYCCAIRCQNCPYTPKYKRGATNLLKKK